MEVVRLLGTTSRIQKVRIDQSIILVQQGIFELGHLCFTYAGWSVQASKANVELTRHSNIERRALS